MAEEAIVSQETPAPVESADAPTPASVVTPEAKKFDEEYYRKALDGQQRRIDELTWRLNRSIDREPEANKEPPQKVEPKVPKLEDFAFDEAKFQSAQTEYLRAEAERIVTERLKAADQTRAVEQRTQTFREREKAFAAKTPDYQDKVYGGETLPISDAMAEEITSSEVGPELALYLANHRDVARQLYELPPRQVAREIGRIEATLLKPAATIAPVTPPVPKVSNAPPPPAKIEAEEAEVVSKEPSQMNQREFDRWRKKYLKK